jgi:hypothetical protein
MAASNPIKTAKGKSPLALGKEISGAKTEAERRPAKTVRQQRRRQVPGGAEGLLEQLHQRVYPTESARKSAMIASEPANDAMLVSTTLRLAPGTRRGLELLQQASGVTLNKLMNEGLAIYVAQRTAALEQGVQASLQRIKRYRKADPTFSKLFAAMAEEEAACGRDDPVEGVAVRVRTGPAVTAVRQLIHGRR